MSKTTSQSKQARQRVDAAVRRALYALRHHGRARRVFEHLLVDVRARSNLLRPVSRGPAIDIAVRALVNLAWHHLELRQSATTWPGGEGSAPALVRTLAAHVVGGYPMPAVLAPVWWLPASAAARQQQRWFIEHARGRPFRDVAGLPLALTRRMERIFLGSPAHLSVPAALRRAELLGLGAEPALVETILGTPLGRDLDDGAWWRPVLHWFVNRWDALGTAGVLDLLPYFRHRLGQGPWSAKGRTVASVQRDAARWRGEPDPRRTGYVAWAGFGVALWSCPARTPGALGRWTMVELRNSAALAHEGRALHHCVGTYVWACRSGRSRIWSLRWEVPGTPMQSRYTIEVEPVSRRVVQIRGLRNRRVAGEAATVIERWAIAHALQVPPGA